MRPVTLYLDNPVIDKAALEGRTFQLHLLTRRSIPMSDTNGRMVGFNHRNEFVYAYTCSACGVEYRDTAPSTAPPVVCHHCYTGTRTRSSRRGAAHVQPPGRRKKKHDSEAS